MAVRSSKMVLPTNQLIRRHNPDQSAICSEWQTTHRHSHSNWPVNSTKSCGERQYSATHSETRHWIEVIGQLHATAAVPQVKESSSSNTKMCGPQSWNARFGEEKAQEIYRLRNSAPPPFSLSLSLSSDRQADRQTHKHTHSLSLSVCLSFYLSILRQTDRHTHSLSLSRSVSLSSDRQTDRHTHTYTLGYIINKICMYTLHTRSNYIFILLKS